MCDAVEMVNDCSAMPMAEEAETPSTAVAPIDRLYDLAQEGTLAKLAEVLEKTSATCDSKTLAAREESYKKRLKLIEDERAGEALAEQLATIVSAHRMEIEQMLAVAKETIERTRAHTSSLIDEHHTRSNMAETMMETTALCEFKEKLGAADAKITKLRARVSALDIEGMREEYEKNKKVLAALGLEL
jgi:uncharacterized membrane protein YgaE (UPF0421/DUF939 family)